MSRTCWNTNHLCGENDSTSLFKESRPRITKDVTTLVRIVAVEVVKRSLYPMLLLIELPTAILELQRRKLGNKSPTQSDARFYVIVQFRNNFRR